MKKTTLIGTILATTILVLMSFTSTVGAQALKDAEAHQINNYIEGILETPLDRILQALFSIFLGIIYWWGTHQHPP